MKNRLNETHQDFLVPVKGSRKRKSSVGPTDISITGDKHPPVKRLRGHPQTVEVKNSSVSPAKSHVVQANAGKSTRSTKRYGKRAKAPSPAVSATSQIIRDEHPDEKISLLKEDNPCEEAEIMEVASGKPHSTAKQLDDRKQGSFIDVQVQAEKRVVKPRAKRGKPKTKITTALIERGQEIKKEAKSKNQVS